MFFKRPSLAGCSRLSVTGCLLSAGLGLLLAALPAWAETVFSDAFDGHGPLEKVWVGNADYTQTEGAARPTKPGHLKLGEPLTLEAGKVYVLAFKGVTLSTPNADGDNWLGAMEFTNGWTPERGIAIRLTESNKVQVCVDLGGPGEFKSDTPLRLEPGTEYDLFFRFSPGGEVKVYYSEAGGQPQFLTGGGKAPEGSINLGIYTDTALISVSEIRIEAGTEAEADAIFGETAAAAMRGKKAGIPESMLMLLDNLKKMNLSKYPIGFWNYVKLDTDFEVMNEETVAAWAEMGCTVAQAPFWNVDDPKQHARIRDILKWSGEKGIKVILRDSRLAGPKFDEAVAEFGHNPSMFGYHIGDELAPKEMMGSISEMTRKLQEKLPALHTHYNQFAIWPEWELFPGYASPRDFELAFVKQSKSALLSYDNYTQFWPGPDGVHPKYGATGWDKYFLNLRIFRETSARSGVPFWSTICSASHMLCKIVSYDQLRWQFTTAVCSGANGVEYFVMYQWDPAYNYRDTPIDAFWQKTKTFYDLKTIHQSFHRRYGDLFNRIVPTRVTFVGKVYGEGEKFTPNDVISHVAADEVESNAGHPFLVGEFVDRAGQRYVMVVNNSITDSAKVRLRFPGRGTRLFSWDWNGREYEGLANAETKVSVPKPVVVGNEIEINGGWLAPGQELVYRVDSDSARNSPITATN